MTSRTPRRGKLGLALAGGGFRASLFHLGVFRRMAELDLLRYVEVLSTVSGGSIIGALYFLILKKYLDRSPDGNLTRRQYIEIAEEIEATLVRGIRKNLRTRLFMNPLGVLRVMLTGHSLGKRMARLYERYLFQEVVQELKPQSRLKRWLRPGRFRLSDLHVKPGGKKLTGGIETYNREQVRNGRSVVPLLIINATSLNSGARFWYSHTEIGDWYLGHIRFSEIDDLLARKRLLHLYRLPDLEEKLGRAPPGIETIRIAPEDSPYDGRTVSLAVWWRRRAAEGETPRGWEALFAKPGFPGKLATAPLGALRQVKIPAWYMRKGLEKEEPVHGGGGTEEHLSRFWDALRIIDEDLYRELEPTADPDADFRDLLLDFVLELYWLRSAEVVSFHIKRDWEHLTLGSAVGASACFPPVFPPFLEPGIFDDLHVSLLGLTDGGVFDNIGITALRDEQCNHIIASDTSGPLGMKQHASAGRFGVVGRVIGIVMGAVAGLQRERLKEARRMSDAVEGVHELEGLAFFHMSSPRLELPRWGVPGLELAIDREALGRMRTDLDGFGDVEMDALVNHGYDTADRTIRKYLVDKELFAPTREHGGTVARPPRPTPTDSRRANRIVRVGQARLFRSLMLGAPVSWAFTFLLVIGFVRAIWGEEWSLKAGLHSLSTWIISMLDRSLWFLRSGWTESTIQVGPVLLGLAGAALVLLSLGRLCKQSREEAPAECGGRKRLTPWRTRRLATACKWSRLYAGNLLWLVTGLPLLLAVGISIVAWTSHVFFFRPFLAKTRRTGTRKQ